jgi:hypothetical protein
MNIQIFLITEINIIVKMKKTRINKSPVKKQLTKKMVNYYDQLKDCKQYERKPSVRSKSPKASASKSLKRKQNVPMPAEDEIHYDDSLHVVKKISRVTKLMSSEVERCRADGALDLNKERLDKTYEGYPSFMKRTDTLRKSIDSGNSGTPSKPKLLDLLEHKLQDALKLQPVDIEEDPAYQRQSTPGSSHSSAEKEQKYFHLEIENHAKFIESPLSKRFDFHQRKSKEIRRLQYMADCEPKKIRFKPTKKIQPAKKDDQIRNAIKKIDVVAPKNEEIKIEENPATPIAPDSDTGSVYGKGRDRFPNINNEPTSQKATDSLYDKERMPKEVARPTVSSPDPVDKAPNEIHLSSRDVEPEREATINQSGIQDETDSCARNDNWGRERADEPSMDTAGYNSAENEDAEKRNLSRSDLEPPVERDPDSEEIELVDAEQDITVNKISNEMNHLENDEEPQDEEAEEEEEPEEEQEAEEEPEEEEEVIAAIDHYPEACDDEEARRNEFPYEMEVDEDPEHVAQRVDAETMEGRESFFEFRPQPNCNDQESGDEMQIRGDSPGDEEPDNPCDEEQEPNIEEEPEEEPVEPEIEVIEDIDQNNSIRSYRTESVKQWPINEDTAEDYRSLPVIEVAEVVREEEPDDEEIIEVIDVQPLEDYEDPMPTKSEPSVKSERSQAKSEAKSIKSIKFQMKSNPNEMNSVRSSRNDQSVKDEEPVADDQLNFQKNKRSKPTDRYPVWYLKKGETIPALISSPDGFHLHPIDEKMEIKQGDKAFVEPVEMGGFKKTRGIVHKPLPTDGDCDFVVIDSDKGRHPILMNLRKKTRKVTNPNCTVYDPDDVKLGRARLDLKDEDSLKRPYDILNGVLVDSSNSVSDVLVKRNSQDPKNIVIKKSKGIQQKSKVTKQQFIQLGPHKVEVLTLEQSKHEEASKAAPELVFLMNPPFLITRNLLLDDEKGVAECENLVDYHQVLIVDPFDGEGPVALDSVYLISNQKNRSAELPKYVRLQIDNLNKNQKEIEDFKNLVRNHVKKQPVEEPQRNIMGLEGINLRIVGGDGQELFIKIRDKDAPQSAEESMLESYESVSDPEDLYYQIEYNGDILRPQGTSPKKSAYSKPETKRRESPKKKEAVKIDEAQFRFKKGGDFQEGKSNPIEIVPTFGCTNLPEKRPMVQEPKGKKIDSKTNVAPKRIVPPFKEKSEDSFSIPSTNSKLKEMQEKATPQRPKVETSIQSINESIAVKPFQEESKILSETGTIETKKAAPGRLEGKKGSLIKEPTKQTERFSTPKRRPEEQQVNCRINMDFEDNQCRDFVGHGKIIPPKNRPSTPNRLFQQLREIKNQAARTLQVYWRYSLIKDKFRGKNSEMIRNVRKTLKSRRKYEGFVQYYLSLPSDVSVDMAFESYLELMNSI